MIGHLTSQLWFWGAYSGVLLVAWRFLAGYYAHKSPHTSDQTIKLMQYDRHSGTSYSTGKTQVVADGYKKGDPDWTFGFWNGLGTVLFWPLVVAGICVFQTLAHWPSALKSGPERQYVAAKQKQHMAEKVRRLETEVLEIES